MLRSLIIAITLIATPLMAQETVVVDLSQNRVEITATYSGSDILCLARSSARPRCLKAPARWMWRL